MSQWAVAAGLLRAPVAQGRARPSRACSRRAAGTCCPRPPTSTTGSRLPQYRTSGNNADGGGSSRAIVRLWPAPRVTAHLFGWSWPGRRELFEIRGHRMLRIWWPLQGGHIDTGVCLAAGVPRRSGDGGDCAAARRRQAEGGGARRARCEVGWECVSSDVLSLMCY